MSYGVCGIYGVSACYGRYQSQHTVWKAIAEIDVFLIGRDVTNVFCNVSTVKCLFNCIHEINIH
jgi:hypothetical protein